MPVAEIFFSYFPVSIFFSVIDRLIGGNGQLAKEH